MGVLYWSVVADSMMRSVCSSLLDWLVVRIPAFGSSSLGRVMPGTWHLLGGLMIEDREPEIGFPALLWMMYDCLYWY